MAITVTIKAKAIDFGDYVGIQLPHELKQNHVSAHWYELRDYLSAYYGFTLRNDVKAVMAQLRGLLVRDLGIDPYKVGSRWLRSNNPARNIAWSKSGPLTVVTITLPE